MKGADRKYVRPAPKVLWKREFGGLSPFLFCPGKWSGLNRISHPHWVKVCDDHNGQLFYAPNKNTKFFLLQMHKNVDFTSVFKRTTQLHYKSIFFKVHFICCVFLLIFIYWVARKFGRYFIKSPLTKNQYLHQYIQDILTLNKQKKRQDKIIYTYRSI